MVSRPQAGPAEGNAALYGQPPPGAIAQMLNPAQPLERPRIRRTALSGGLRVYSQVRQTGAARQSVSPAWV
jgi:hypothetical protein